MEFADQHQNVQRKEVGYARSFEHAQESFNEFLIKNDPPTLHGLLKREGIKEAELPFYFRSVVDGFIGDPIKNEEVLKFVYETYLATRSVSEKDVLATFSNSLDNFEGFRKNYLKDASEHQIRDFFNGVNFFRDQVIHPSRKLTLFDAGIERHLWQGIYMYHGDWVLIPEVKKRYSFEVVDRSVIIDAIKLKKLGFRSELSHTTASAALDGIAKFHKIISSELLEKLREPIQTGEYATDRMKAHEVYASENDCHKGYDVIRWFNEYPIAFAFPLDKQKEYIEKKFPKHPFLYRFFWTSDGMYVGPEVPLENVTHMVTDHQNLDEAKTWAAKNAPNLIITSFDAYNLWRMEKDSERGFDRLEDLLKLPHFER